MSAIDLARDALKKHEGYRKFSYQCTAGRTTVAYGRNVQDKGISLSEAELLLDNDIAECIQDLATFSYWNNLSPYQQAALIDLRFCLGPARFRSFQMMRKALEIGDYTEASYQVLHSKYHDQVGKRAEDIAAWLLMK